MRAFRIAYDGREYHGFQRQPTVETIEGELLAGLAALEITDDRESVPPGYAAAGRTDAGVSAIAQTVAFETPDWLTPSAFNSQLPAEIRVWGSAKAPAGFHATHDATARTYQYHLHAPAADPERATAALERLSGPQDVANLTTDDCGTDRTLDPELTVDDPFLVVRIRAGGFPRQFVRRAVELVRRVATGAADVETVDRVLDPTPLPGPEGIPPAPPEPLLLTEVEYPSLSFEPDREAVETTTTIFRKKRARQRAGARVAGQVANAVDRQEE